MEKSIFKFHLIFQSSFLSRGLYNKFLCTLYSPNNNFDIVFYKREGNSAYINISYDPQKWDEVKKYTTTVLNIYIKGLEIFDVKLSYIDNTAEIEIHNDLRNFDFVIYNYLKLAENIDSQNAQFDIQSHMIDEFFSRLISQNRLDEDFKSRAAKIYFLLSDSRDMDVMVTEGE